MKVENPFGNLLNKIDSKNAKPGKTDTKGVSFSKVLEDAKGTKAEAAGAVSAPGWISSSLDLNMIQKQAISRGEDTLTLLNHLASLLDRPTETSAIKEVANALDSSSNNLQALKEKLDVTDPLRKVIDQIAVLSVVEKIKITRGDYT